MTEIIFNKEQTLEERRQLIQERLQKGVCEVTFTKVNGEKRVMPCTLSSDIIPPQPVKESTKVKKPNPEVMGVWCTDKDSWRSFRLDSVESIRLVNS